MNIFLSSSFVYSCHLFLISSASVRSRPSVLYWAHLCMKSSLVCLIFLKRSLVFPIVLFSSISQHCLLKKAFLSLLAFVGSSAFSRVYLSLSPFALKNSLTISAIHPCMYFPKCSQPTQSSLVLIPQSWFCFQSTHQVLNPLAGPFQTFSENEHPDAWWYFKNSTCTVVL